MFQPSDRFIRRGGFTFIEILVAIGVMGLVGLILAVFLTNKMEQEHYLRARQSVLDDVDAIYSDIRRSWEFRDRAAVGGPVKVDSVSPFINNRLTISMKPKNGIGVDATLVWESTCVAIPAKFRLSSSQQVSLKSIAQKGCNFVCPSGQRPVIHFTSSDKGGMTREIPAKGGFSAREQTLGLALCLTGGTNLDVQLFSAFLRPGGDVQSNNRKFQLNSVDEFGTGVEILR